LFFEDLQLFGGFGAGCVLGFGVLGGTTDIDDDGRSFAIDAVLLGSLYGEWRYPRYSGFKVGGKFSMTTSLSPFYSVSRVSGRKEIR